MQRFSSLNFRLPEFGPGWPLSSRHFRIDRANHRHIAHEDIERGAGAGATLANQKRLVEQFLLGERVAQGFNDRIAVANRQRDCDPRVKGPLDAAALSTIAASDIAASRVFSGGIGMKPS